MRSSIIFLLFSFTLFFNLHYEKLSVFAAPQQDNSSQIIPSITQNILAITSILPSAGPTPEPNVQPTTNAIVVITQNLIVITITSVSTVFPSIPAAHNPNLPSGSNNGFNGNYYDDGGNSSGLVIGVSVIGSICLIGALTAFCYCYRRHRLSLQYDDDGGEVVLRVDRDPFQSTLDQYHRNRY
ncbi:15697_t:CDS:2 [Cetraspora pellucida]|uniref:15697_t:CDS:1 n=1 Tax=Cetraspora pellucida TaxID=1433469 RepID=A0A9N9H5T9_9GLOM|nr:15697_t:CDS:2 [Cetraspora pellucida]